MLNHGFYISNKEISTDSAYCLRGSWKVAALTTFVFALFMAVALSITILTSIFVEWWFSIPFGVLTILLFGIFENGYSENNQGRRPDAAQAQPPGRRDHPAHPASHRRVQV